MWYDEAVFYQIYPLGFCDALYNNDGVVVSRIKKVKEWIPHMKKLGINAIYFSPVFDSEYHGYDTKDFRKIDSRLGTNEDFADVVGELHKNHIRVIIDGVFNHVGREFFAFKDVQEKKWESQYKDWFNVSFDGNSNYNDGFWYEGWEGHYNLVKLNLRNDNVVNYLLNCIRSWIDEFDIDGLRLDVAYLLDHNFMRRLRAFTGELKEDFFLLGEMLHGDYNIIVNDSMLHSATNYECYKGLYSSFNSMNMFEIAHSIQRQFGKEQWCLYRGKHLLNFVDNHDVNRIASTLTNKKHLPLIYGLMCSMPGIPCIYYGSEWGAEGVKANGSDNDIRKSYDTPEWNELTETVAACVKAAATEKALQYGDYETLVLTNHQYVFRREFEGEKIIVAINASDNPYVAHFDAGCGRAVDLITGKEHDFGGGSEMQPYTVAYWKCEK
ncbi:MAG: maltodextrin glucosidase [Lachnospiraceae bacterium]